jgi:hypothetical protein
MSVTGKIPTDKSIEAILKNIAKQSGLRKVTYTYRCGPIVNNPTTFINEVSHINEDYDLSLIDSELNLTVLDDETKKDFIQMLLLKRDKYGSMITGEILNNYLIERNKK